MSCKKDWSSVFRRTYDTIGSIPEGAMQKNHVISWRPVGQNLQDGDIFLRKRGGLTYQSLGGLHHLWSWWSSYVVSNELISGSGTRRERKGLVSQGYTRSIGVPRSSCRTLVVYDNMIRLSLVWDVKLSFLRRVNPVQRRPRNGMVGVRPWPMAYIHQPETWDLKHSTA